MPQDTTGAPGPQGIGRPTHEPGICPPGCDIRRHRLELYDDGGVQFQVRRLYGAHTATGGELVDVARRVAKWYGAARYVVRCELHDGVRIDETFPPPTRRTP